MLAERPSDSAFVEVQSATAGEAPGAHDIRGWVAAVLESVPPAAGGMAPAGPGDVCVRLVDEPESAALNGQYRNKAGPTNVLSFPAEIDLPDVRIWGDIVVCVPLVHAEAAAQGKSVNAHLAHLVMHGVLHLLGYDHQDSAEADRMEALEKSLLERFGIADPYAQA